MKLETFLKAKVKEDLISLYKGYINDEKEQEERVALMKKQSDFNHMTLEQLIKENLEHVHEYELVGFFSDYVREWINMSR